MKIVSSCFLAICGTSIILLGTWIEESTADEEPAAPTTMAPGELTFPLDCKPYHRRSMKVLLKAFHKCSRELKANVTSDKEYEENMGCAMKCTMRTLGYSDETNIVTLESMRKAVSAILPEPLVTPICLVLDTKCHAKYGELLDPTEVQCRSYAEYAFCIQNVIADLVDSDFCIKEEKNTTPKPS